MKITRKLFFTLLGVTTCVVVANLALARWSFQQGFLDFIGGIEQQRLSELGEQLTREYEWSDNNWKFVETLDFEQLLREQARAGMRPLPPHGASGSQRAFKGRPPGSPARVKLRTMGPPTVLYDQVGQLIAGIPPNNQDSPSIRVPLLSNDIQVGELRSWPAGPSYTPLASQFSRQQLWASLMIGLLSLAAASAISWLVAKALLRPVKEVLRGVSELSKGNYQVSFTESRHDELGQLMSNIAALSKTLDKNRTAKQRWFADISHELRTPLTVLKGEIDVLKAGIRPFDAKQLASFEQEIDLLAHLIDDLYQLSLSDMGALRYRFEKQSLTDIVAGVTGSIKRQVANKGLTFSLNCKEDIWASVDKPRIEQLFLNLFANSMAYTDSPGTIQLEVSTLDNLVQITIDDSSPGVPVAECDLLFDPLYRQDSSRERRSSGAGLGLTICKNIVEAHGGRIVAAPSKLGGVQMSILINAYQGNQP